VTAVQSGGLKQTKSAGAAMNVSRNVAEIIRQHVTLEVESIDRLYLNLYAPRLQHDIGVLGFFRERGQAVASPHVMAEITRKFVAQLESFAKAHHIPVITFQKGQRKDDIAASYRAQFSRDEGVVFIGKAQEKATVFRTEKRYNQQTGRSYAWLVRTSAMVNHYYLYAQDRDFGPFFIKFCSYFPYNGKLCLNGHEYAKQQLRQKGIAFANLTVKGLSGSVNKVFRADELTIQFGHLRQKNLDIVAFDTKGISDSIGTEVSGMLGFAMLWMLEIKIDYRDGLVDFIYDPKH
jgi:hypothetical protein